MTTDTKQATSWQLARLADCSDPDQHDGIGFSDDQDTSNSDGSPGARFLRSVESDVLEQMSDGYWSEDSPHEIADSCVPVYTHDLWATFTDLGAYSEDLADITDDTSDMNQNASLALYMIAARLAEAIHEQHEDEDSDD